MQAVLEGKAEDIELWAEQAQRLGEDCVDIRRQNIKHGSPTGRRDFGMTSCAQMLRWLLCNVDPSGQPEPAIHIDE